MQTAKPPRYTLEDHGDRIKITIPTRKSWRLVTAVPSGLAALAGIAVVIAMILGLMFQVMFDLPTNLNPRFIIPTLVILTVLYFSTTSGKYLAYSTLWLLFGKEVIWIDAYAISANNQILGFDHIETYDTKHIQQLRVSPYTRLDRDAWPLTFEHGLDTVHIGLEATEAESYQLLEAILAHFPQYVPVENDVIEPIPAAAVSPNYLIEEHGDSLTVTIPARHRGFETAFSIIWLMFAAIAGVAAICQMMSSSPGLALLATAIWLYVMAFVGQPVVWQLSGEEVITISDQGITFQSSNGLGFKRQVEYQAEFIHNLRAAPYHRYPTQQRGGIRSGDMVVTPLTFDYQDGVARMAFEGLKSENERLAAFILARFPQYGDG